MSKRIIIYMLSASLFMPVFSITQAADETMDSAVYLTFDPVTGQFTSATKDLSESNQFVDTGVHQSKPASSGQPSAGSPATVTASPQPAAVAGDNSSSPALLWPGLFTAVIVAGIIGFFVMRKVSTKTNA